MDHRKVGPSFRVLFKPLTNFGLNSLPSFLRPARILLLSLLTCDEFLERLQFTAQDFLNDVGNICRELSLLPTRPTVYSYTICGGPCQQLGERPFRVLFQLREQLNCRNLILGRNAKIRYGFLTSRIGIMPRLQLFGNRHDA